MLENIEIEIELIELEIEIIEIELEIIKLENEEVNFKNNLIQCSLCFKIFSAFSTLKLHEEIIHESQNKTIKDQLYIDNRNLKDKNLKQLPVEIDKETVNIFCNPIICNICLKTFPAISTLNLHMEISHEYCNEANPSPKCFENNSDFNKHKKSSTGERCVKIHFQYDDYNITSAETCSEERFGFHESERFMKRYFSNDEEDFCDVALVCDDQQIRTHNMVKYQNSECWMTKIQRKDDKQNFIFQIF